MATSRPPPIPSEVLQAECCGENQAVIDLMTGLHKPLLQHLVRGEGNGATVLVLPMGMQAHSIKTWLDEYADKPERKTGTAVLTTLESFCEHVTRFKDPHSVVFAIDDPHKPALLAMLDYHEPAAGAPRFGQHRSRYNFPLSDEWVEWRRIHGEQQLTVRQFAEFIEDRITDVMNPDEAGASVVAFATQLGLSLASPAELMELSRGLTVNVGNTIANHQNLSSGEAEIAFTQKHTDKQGAPLMVPGAFVLGIPVFKGGDPFQVPVRLRYRVYEGVLTWKIALYRTDLVFRSAFDEACSTVENDTECKVLVGTPEDFKP
jgi:hypothetical protein